MECQYTLANEFLKKGVKEYALGGCVNKKLSDFAKSVKDESVELLAGAGVVAALTALSGGVPAFVAGTATFATAVLINYFRKQGEHPENKPEPALGMGI